MLMLTLIQTRYQCTEADNLALNYEKRMSKFLTWLGLC
jgi:hypothetical protein